MPGSSASPAVGARAPTVLQHQQQLRSRRRARLPSRASEVRDLSSPFSELAHTWPTWESETHQPPIVDNKVRIVYDGDYGSERVLISSGRATIIPDDGSPTITVGPGDD